MPVEDTESDSDDSFNDIELAYREALKSIDEAEMQVGSALMELSEVGSTDSESEETAFTSIGDSLAKDLAGEQARDDELAALHADRNRVSPRAVIEAALFVGGEVSLTARRLASLIGKDTDSRVAVKLIDQLNEDYRAENRAYEIQLHEGGFRLALRESFADVQVQVFGLGPREVRLSPEALEVLAFVAYNQPVQQQDFEQVSLSRPQVVLRQLIRLNLVEVERTGSRRSDVAWRTGQKFLKLFGLDSIDDLPQADIFNFK